MARKLVMNYGMSDAVGPVVLGEAHEMVFLGKDIGEQRNYSEEVAKKIDEEVAKILKHGYERATEVLTKYRSILDTIAKRLPFNCERTSGGNSFRLKGVADSVNSALISSSAAQRFPSLSNPTTRRTSFSISARFGSS